VIIRTAFIPWSAPIGHSSSITTLAWLDVALVVMRAVQIALTRDSFARTVRSVVVASIAYFALFLAAATQHSPQLAHATRFIEPIFLVYFVLALASLRLSRATNIEETSNAEHSTTGDVRWRLLLALPLVFIVVVGVSISVVLGSSGGGLRRALLDCGHAIGWFFTKIWEGIAFVIIHVAIGLADAIGFLINLIVRRKVEAPWTRITKSKAGHLTTTSGHVPLGLTVALMVIFCLGLGFGLWLLMRNRSHESVRVQSAGGERRTSTFSWSNLVHQLLAGLHHLLLALMANIRRDKTSQRSTASVIDAPAGLRREYQLFLIRARRQGFGRLAHETALEYSARLHKTLDLQGQDALRRVTLAYERLRYGAGPDRAQTYDEEIAIILAQIMNSTTTVPPASV
jgi:hypothetical protein